MVTATERRSQHENRANALHRLPIAFRADPCNDGAFDVYFCHHRFMRLDLNHATATD